MTPTTTIFDSHGDICISTHGIICYGEHDDRKIKSNSKGAICTIAGFDRDREKPEEITVFQEKGRRAFSRGNAKRLRDVSLGAEITPEYLKFHNLAILKFHNVQSQGASS